MEILGSGQAGPEMLSGPLHGTVRYAAGDRKDKDLLVCHENIKGSATPYLVSLI